MLRITKETDYGILVLACFAKYAQNRALTTRQITEYTGIPYRMVCKILNLLTRNGLLVSQRGVKGGYQLVKSPQEISLEEAISVIEGPITLTECTKSTCDCMALERCFIQEPWLVINRALRAAFQGMTIASMVAANPYEKNLPLAIPFGHDKKGEPVS